MKNSFYSFLRAIALSLIVTNSPAQQTITLDKEWSKQQASIKNTPEADFIIRIGDIDNLNFGWPDEFDPFCGRSTEAHFYPWEAHESDLPGFDRILLSSKFKPAAPKGCSSDGYSVHFNPTLSKPVVYQIPTAELSGAAIRNAHLQLYIDDFQAPSMCSKFQLFIHGARFSEGERILNAIDQTGPVGKLISIPIPEDYFPALLSGKPFLLKIDEASGSADGFAIDFIRLVINQNRDHLCVGSVRGQVLEKDNQKPVAGARVFLSGDISTLSNEQGEFTLSKVPTGLHVVYASADGFADGAANADVGPGDDNPECLIYLERGSSDVTFNGKKMSVGSSIALENILFSQGKADLNPGAKAELDKLFAFLKQNPKAEIELSGHTSSEGDASTNRVLSYKRVKACKDYIIAKGIDPSRMLASGFGPDRPVAPNDTEANRAMNRRVEMRIMRLQ